MRTNGGHPIKDVRKKEEGVKLNADESRQGEKGGDIVDISSIPISSSSSFWQHTNKIHTKYIKIEIKSISVTVSYRHFRYQFFSIYWYRIRDKWNIGNLSIFYHTFSAILMLKTTIIWLKISILWHYRKTLPPDVFKFGPLPNAYISCSTYALLHFSVFSPTSPQFT